MLRYLPPKPNLEHLKKQAKELLDDFEKQEPGAIARFRALKSQPAQPVKLADAQHAIAREYGFANWAKLKEHVEWLNADPVQALVITIKTNAPARARQVLERYPELKSRLNDPLPGLDFGSTALVAATPWANREMIELLLQSGAEINQKSHWWAGGFGVLDVAARSDRPAWLAPYLIEHGAVVDVHAATQLGMLDKLRELIFTDPQVVHARGGDGQTPLHFAPTVEIAEYLLDHGADINALDIDHESTPAQYMVRERQDVARYLVKRGCKTDILMAAALGDIELVRKHLNADPASIRMSVSEEYFPMRDSRAGGTIYIWCLGRYKTAHLVAREFGHEEIFQFLMDYSPTQLKLSLACELGDEPLFKSLMASRPNLVETLSDNEYRKIADAAQSNNTQAVKLMAAAGWPVDFPGQHGLSPLHWAAWHGNVEMVRHLLHHGASLELRGNEWDITPLTSALHGSEHGWHKDTGDYGSTVEALLRAGAKAPELSDDLEASDAARAVLRRYAAARAG
jgi:Ankyrin repeats (3 copies)/Ankyrin repeat